jgi:hypothetical protein
MPGEKGAAPQTIEYQESILDVMEEAQQVLNVVPASEAANQAVDMPENHPTMEGNALELFEKGLESEICGLKDLGHSALEAIRKSLENSQAQTTSAEASVGETTKDRQAKAKAMRKAAEAAVQTEPATAEIETVRTRETESAELRLPEPALEARLQAIELPEAEILYRLTAEEDKPAAATEAAAEVATPTEFTPEATTQINTISTSEVQAVISVQVEEATTDKVDKRPVPAQSQTEQAEPADETTVETFDQPLAAQAELGALELTEIEVPHDVIAAVEIPEAPQTEMHTVLEILESPESEVRVQDIVLETAVAVLPEQVSEVEVTPEISEKIQEVQTILTELLITEQDDSTDTIELEQRLETVVAELLEELGITDVSEEMIQSYIAQLREKVAELVVEMRQDIVKKPGKAMMGMREAIQILTDPKSQPVVASVHSLLGRLALRLNMLQQQAA